MTGLSGQKLPVMTEQQLQSAFEQKGWLSMFPVENESREEREKKRQKLERALKVNFLKIYNKLISTFQVHSP